jgi:hypothetical protein
MEGCTNPPFYRIAGSLLAELGLGLLIKGGIDLASAGLLGHRFNPPTDRGAHEERHFLEFGFGFGLPLHREVQARLPLVQGNQKWRIGDSNP